MPTGRLDYAGRLRLYESIKARIAATNPTAEEYERRVTSLANRLGI